MDYRTIPANARRRFKKLMVKLGHARTDDDLAMCKMMCTMAANRISKEDSRGDIKIDFDPKSTPVKFVKELETLFSPCKCESCRSCSPLPLSEHAKGEKDESKYDITWCHDVAETKLGYAQLMPTVMWTFICPGFRSYFVRFAISDPSVTDQHVMDVIDFVTGFKNGVPIFNMIAYAMTIMIHHSHKIRMHVNRSKAMEKCHVSETYKLRRDFADAKKAKDATQATLKVSLNRLKVERAQNAELKRQIRAHRVCSRLKTRVINRLKEVRGDLALRLKLAEESVVDIKDLNAALSRACAKECEDLESKLKRARAGIVAWQETFHSKLKAKVRSAKLAERGKVAEEIAGLREINARLQSQIGMITMFNKTAMLAVA